MWFRLVARPLPRLKRPALIVALSTSMPQYRALYSQAREVAKYLLANMKFEEVGAIYSSSLAPEVIVREGGISSLPSCRFYLHRGKRDVLLLAGDASPMDDQYAFTDRVLAFAKKAGVKEVYSLGARWSESPGAPDQEPELNGFSTDRAGAALLKRLGVKLIKGEPSPFFASLVVAMAAESGMKGYKVSVDHGEPSPHTRTVLKMVSLLSRLVGFQIDVEALRSQVKSPASPAPRSQSHIYH